MTTFVVRRTSDYRGDAQPCPNAYRAQEPEDRPAWLIDIADMDALMAFLAEHNQVIMFDFDDEDHPVIEIYDDYRE